MELFLLYAMSSDREAARVLSSLMKDVLALLGTADSSTLTNFLHGYFGGDENLQVWLD